MTQGAARIRVRSHRWIELRDRAWEDLQTLGGQPLTHQREQRLVGLRSNEAMRRIATLDRESLAFFATQSSWGLETEMDAINR